MKPKHCKKLKINFNLSARDVCVVESKENPDKVSGFLKDNLTIKILDKIRAK